MGVYSHYQALPADGSLLRLLRTDADLYRVYCSLVGKPSGPFTLLRFDEADHQRLCEHLAEAGIEEDDAIRRAVAVFYRELDRTREEAPGVESRGLLVKQGDLWVAIHGLGTPAHPHLGRWLVFGGEDIVAGGWVPGCEGELGLIASHQVHAGAAFMAALAQRVVSIDPDTHRSWLALFRAAAERDEVVVVGAVV